VFRLWVEAASPLSAWFVEARRSEELRIAEPSSIAGRYAIELIANPEGHRCIRAVLREK
jgi:hypothetical protein